MSSPRERYDDPYRALCKELIALTVNDMSHSGISGDQSQAARWLLGETPNPRLSRETVLDVLGYPLPDRDAVHEIDHAQIEAVYEADLTDDWVPATQLRKRIGCSAGTIRGWWYRGDVEGRKARRAGTEQIMIRDDERLRKRIEQYQNSRYGNA